MTWQTKKLSEVCIIKPPKSEARIKLMEDDLVSFVPMEDMGILRKKITTNKERKLKEVSGSYTYFADGDVLIAKITPCFENGKIGIAHNLKNGIGFGSSEYIVFRPKKELVAEYLFYFLSNDDFRREGRKNMSGAVGHKRISKEYIENTLLPFPPLPEQHRLVKLLDEVFVNIAKAKENAEKNLQNSKELFESYLQGVFANTRINWELINFDDSIEKVTYTNKIQRNKFLESGKFPIISQEKELINGYWNNEADLFHIKNPCIIFGDHTKILKYVDFDFVLGADGVKILQPKNILFPRFFYYYLSSVDLKSLGYARHYRLLKEKHIAFPKSLAEQKSIVAKLDSLSAKTKKLETIYKQKLADLEELKKSVLKKAFNGEL